MAKTILIPLDGSDASESCVYEATKFLDRDGTLLLVRVLELPELTAWAPVDSLSVLDAEEATVKDYLRTVRERWEEKGFKVKTLVHPGPNAAVSIVDTAGRESADLIVMSSHGRTGLARLFLGSVAEKVVRLCKTPITIFKPDLPKENTSDEP